MSLYLLRSQKNRALLIADTADEILEFMSECYWRYENGTIEPCDISSDSIYELYKGVYYMHIGKHMYEKLKQIVVELQPDKMIDLMWKKSELTTISEYLFGILMFPVDD